MYQEIIQLLARIDAALTKIGAGGTAGGAISEQQATTIRDGLSVLASRAEALVPPAPAPAPTPAPPAPTA